MMTQVAFGSENTRFLTSCGVYFWTRLHAPRSYVSCSYASSHDL